MRRLDIDNLLSELGVEKSAPGANERPASGQPSAGGGGGAEPAAPAQRPDLQDLDLNDDSLIASPPRTSLSAPGPVGAPAQPPSPPAGPAPASGPVQPPGVRGAPDQVPASKAITPTKKPERHMPFRPDAPVPATARPETLSEIYQPDAQEGDGQRAELGQYLLSCNAVTAQQLTAAQTILKQSPAGSQRRLTDILIEQGADEFQVQQAVAQFANVAFERVDLNRGLDGGFEGKLLQRLTADFCKQNMVLPLRVEESGRVVLGATRPDDVFLIDEVRRRLGVPRVKLVVVAGYDIKGALEIVGASDTSKQQVDLSSILSEVDEADVQVEKSKSETEVDLEKESSEGPVIRYVNYIIQTAVKDGASDIHIEPSEKKLKVRFRIDGELYENMNPPAALSSAITSRLKIMANMAIDERRIPQNGRIRCVVGGRKLDLRVSTLPTTYGEKTVMRILDTRSINVQLEDLGFSENAYELWKRQIDAPHGIVLVTGPTGSGKTTTLYSSLRQLDKNSMNICTVEDPVEYHLDGITQTQTHEKIGMTFALALKALLRQDPDVIMLGEIRDQETAHTAIQAALTGHLVLSTLHTNDAPSSITRLVNIGIEPFLVGAAINGVLAQRLVRRLCLHCKQQARPTEERAEYLQLQGIDPDKVSIAKGCDRCRNTGYSGRVGIYEILPIDDQVRDVIARNPNVAEFRRMCIERGMVTLRDDGMTKVAKGLTTVEEVLRVTEAAH